MMKKNQKKCLGKKGFLGIIVLSWAVMMACQPTPEAEIITQKEDIHTVIEDYSGESGETQTGESAKGQTLAMRLGVPETVEFNILAEEGRIQITGDHVPVEFPDTDKAGAAAIVRADPSDEKLWDMIGKFTGGVTLYEPAPLTKEDYQAAIERTQEEINRIMESGSDVEKLTIPSLEEEIQFRQSQMETAPSKDSLSLVPISGTWEKGEGGMDVINGENQEGEMRYSVYAVSDPSVYTIALVKYPKERSVSERLTTRATMELMGFPSDDPFWQQLDDTFSSVSCTYTQEEAAQAALDFLSEYGIDTTYIMVQKIEPVAWYNSQTSQFSQSCVGYQMTLCHGVGDLMPTITDNHIMFMDANGDIPPENQGRVPYDYEAMTITVTDDGVVDFYWNNPMEVTEILSEDVAMKSFEEIKAIMDRQMVTAYESYSFSDGYEQGRPLSIGKVTFGMMRVQNPDDESEYTLIPVWDVFASDEMTPEEVSTMSMLTINAMDGSIISRENGY